MKKVEDKFGKEETDGKVECPEFWGGWRVVPEFVSLHLLIDRLRVEKLISLAFFHFFAAVFFFHSEVEFWSGQPSRLHDRFRYLRLDKPTEDGKEWQVDRLSP